MIAILLAFGVAYGARQSSRIARESATFDEPGNLLAGYSALAHGDYRPAIEHPPLARIWAALPLLAIPDVGWDPSGWAGAAPGLVATAGPFDTGHAFLYQQNDANTLLYPARLTTVFLGIALGGLVFAWAGAWLGLRAAVIALALYLLEPNLTAHAGLVTTDLAVTLAMFAALFFFWRITGRWTTGRVAGLALSVAAAVLCKFSALLLGPILLVLIALAVWRQRVLTPRAGLVLVAVITAATWIAAWATYGFRFAPSADAGWLFALDQDPGMRRTLPLMASLAGWVNGAHLLPNAMIEGFLHGQGLVQGRPGFLAGSYSYESWWYYFPAAFLLKTPVGLIALFGVGVVACARRRRTASFAGDACVVLPIVLFLAVAMTSSLAIGVRHILPIYPFVILTAALGAESLLRAAATRRGHAIVALALAVTMLEVGRAWTHPLAFFNTLAGGPSNGFRFLADSNVDWGQDLVGLRDWMTDEDVAHVNLAYFGTADPAYHDIAWTPLWGTTVPGLAPDRIGPPVLPGYVAVSVTLLDGVPFQADARGFYAPLRDLEPVADIGGSIRVYWIERPWWPVRR